MIPLCSKRRVTEMKNLLHSVVLVAALMSTIGADELVYAQLGDKVTLHPPAGINLQKDYVYWFREKGGLELAGRNPHGKIWTSSVEPWKGNLSLSEASLIITNIREEYFGSIFFKHSVNEVHSFTEYKLLKVNVSVQPPSPLMPGDSLALSCTAETPQGHKKPAIHWLNPQGMTDNLEGLSWRAKSHVRGQWTCVVTNDRKEYKANISVTVLDLSPGPSHQYTSKSWPLTIPCSFPDHITWQQITAKNIQEAHWLFVPKASWSPQRLFDLSLKDPVTWQAVQDRGLRPIPDPKKGNLSLTRKRGREEDGGNYTCALKFKNGVTLTRTVHVEVLQIISSPTMHVISGQQLNLTCGLGRPLPSDLRLKWFPPERSSLSSLPPDRHPAHLAIPEVGTGDGGKWRCELWQSNARLASAELTLDIEAKLSVWMLVVICSVTAIAILLFILGFILYRRRQKMRHLRRRLCKCKSPKPKGFYRT